MLLGNLTIAQIISSMTALLLALTVHEAMHAFAAYRMGDTTAQRAGRLSLNPLAHLDPVGTLMILLVGFGWGKPVPVDPRQLNPTGRRGMALVAIAGPISNLLLAALFALPFRAGLITRSMMFNSDIIPGIGQVLLTIVQLNVYLAVFNLLPVPPLDGSNVLLGILPRGAAMIAFARLYQYGPLLLMLVLMSGYLFRFDIIGRTLVPVATAILRLLLT